MTGDGPLDRSVVLIGLMGAGKTSVGRRVAARLGVDFVDSDQEIEAAAGIAIADIFEVYGEVAFRNVERRIIDRLLGGPPQVVATGGGAFMDPETRQCIARRATSVWLRADLDLLISRTAGRTHRPLLNSGDPEAILRELMAKRYPVYAAADIAVDTCDEPVSKTVNKVLAALGQTKAAEEEENHEAIDHS